MKPAERSVEICAVAGIPLSFLNHSSAWMLLAVPYLVTVVWEAVLEDRAGRGRY